MHQITFEDYIRDKNMSYARTCRHHEGNYCYIYMREPEQCPCENYEVRKSCFENRIPCTGQTKMYKGLSKCFSGGTICYRYCVSPCNLTKDLPDKYESSR